MRDGYKKGAGVELEGNSVGFFKFFFLLAL